MALVTVGVRQLAVWVTRHWLQNHLGELAREFLENSAARKKCVAEMAGPPAMIAVHPDTEQSQTRQKRDREQDVDCRSTPVSQPARGPFPQSDDGHNEKQIETDS